MIARLALLLLLASAALAQKPAVFDQVDEVLASLAQITGWKVERNVPAETLSREKFRQLVETSLKKAARDKDLAAVETAMRMLGLLPQDSDLVKLTGELYSEQAAAFYDFRKKRLFLLEGSASGEEQTMAVVHELAHALADQRHSIGKYLWRGNPDDDAVTAREAVTEGQATWLTWAYLSQRSGGKAEVPRFMIERIASGVGGKGEDFPVFSRAPLYIRLALLFPYTEGLRFQDAVYRERGRTAFDEVFRRPPASTQQVMHASVYLSGTPPTHPRIPALRELLGREAPGFRTLLEGPLGEFDVGTLLRQYAGEREGASAASHLRGGAFRLYRHKTAKFPVLAHVTQWDSPAAARRYFELYQQVLRGKWRTLELAGSGADEVHGSGDTGRFLLRLRGDLMEAVEGWR